MGTLEPGASIRVELIANKSRNLSGHLKAKAQKYMSDQPWNRDNLKIDRAELMEAVMFHDSESTPTNERGWPTARCIAST